MSDPTFWLIAGSYAFSCGCYLFGWKIVTILARIERQLEHSAGVIEGQDLEQRVTRLERHIAVPPTAAR